jgi:hypothetical protein
MGLPLLDVAARAGDGVVDREQPVQFDRGLLVELGRAAVQQRAQPPGAQLLQRQLAGLVLEQPLQLAS